MMSLISRAAPSARTAAATLWVRCQSTNINSRTVRQPWENLAYSFKVDFEAPDFVTPANMILDIEDKDVDQSANSKCITTIECVASEASSSSDFASSVGLEASFGCFSTSASLGIYSSGTMMTKTMRTDSKTTATTGAVTGNIDLRAYPHDFLNGTLATIIKEGERDMADFEDLIGHFYCKSCQLGGVFQKSYIVEMSSSDTAESIESSLKASYGPDLFGVSAEASVGVSQSSHNAEAMMRVEQLCLGGDTELWLAATQDNQPEVKANWAASITDENVYPINMQLGFVWDLVKALNPEYGLRYENHLLEKWAISEIDYDSLEYLAEGTPIVYGDKVKLVNQYSPSEGYLEICNRTDRGGLKVYTSDDPNRDVHDKDPNKYGSSGDWMIKKSVDGFSSTSTGDQARAGDMVKLINDFDPKIGWLDTFGEIVRDHGEGRGVETSKYENRNNGSGTWQIVKVRSDGLLSTNGELVMRGDNIKLINQANTAYGYLDVFGETHPQTAGFGVETTEKGNRGGTTWQIIKNF